MKKKPTKQKPVAPIIDENKKSCTKCLKLKNIKTDYYLANHPFFSDGRYCVCKTCIREMVNDVYNPDDVKNVMRMLDLPFLSDVYNTSIEESQRRNMDAFGVYMKNVGMNQYKGMSYADSDFNKSVQQIIHRAVENKKTETESDENIIESFTQEELQELQSFWGRGYSIEEYEFLTNEYQRLINSYECDSYAMELLFQEAAQQRLTIKKRREKGDSVDKELKTLQDLLGSANIKPAQETGANAVEQATFGTLVKKYENEKPIPKPNPEWEDVDGIRKYVNVWFLGHLCKMLGIKNDYADQYEKEVNEYRVEAPKYEEEEGAS